MANLKPTPPPGDSMPQGMSDHAIKVVGFLVAGGVLVGLAEVAPDAAIGLALVLGLGVLLTHGNELEVMAAALAHATGH